ncbi:MAG: hypothetical protein Q8L81_12790, partial [Bacteroidota bacterium]|nr:hypothetical protein [Bacteroidota bacterium]
MKKITLGLSVLAVVALFLTSCNKKEAPAPVADTEFESAVDASYANTIATDIDMIVGFIGENAYPKFVNVAAGLAQPTIAVDNTVPGQSSMTWPSGGVKCADGKVRSGTIVVTYSFTDINASYYRDYGFIAFVSLNNYVVDGWSIDDSTTMPANNTTPRFTITNLAPSANPNPATTKLKWSISGYLNIKNVADPTKRMVWNGKMNKTISNTSSLLPPPNNLTPITWTMAVVEYDGEFKGVTPGNVPYTYTVGTEKPLVRNYTCSPDKVLGFTTTPSVSVVNSEFHPFISGVASFTTAE